MESKLRSFCSNRMKFIFIALFFSSFIHKEPTNSTCGTDSRVFQHGEKLIYKIFYNWNFVWIPAGEVEFTVEESPGHFHYKAIGYTYKSYDWFFKVRDRYEAVVRKTDLLPIYSIREVQEGKYQLYDSLIFNTSRSQVISYRGKTRENVLDSVFQLNTCTHDILSMVYYARSLELGLFNQGEILPANVFIDKMNWPLEIQIGEKNPHFKIKDLGKFSTIRFSPNVKSGYYFNDKTRMNIWVTDDDHRIPLMIETPISVGSIKVILKESHGLK
jgi:hypothetical protein